MNVPSSLPIAWRSGLLALAGVCLGSAWAQPTPGPLAAPPATPAVERFMAGRLLVVSKPGVSPQELDKRLARLNLVRQKAVGGPGGFAVMVPPGQEKKLLLQLQQDPAFASVELDRLLPLQFTPNDPSLGQQWGLSAMNTAAAWDVTLGAGQTIAILDTGTQSDHPDLAANMVPGYNFHDNNTDSSDVQGHGTATAGTAAAVGNNGLGVSGVCPQCKIMPLRISMPDGMAYLSTMATAIQYAADRGIRVANLSYGGVDSGTVANAASYLRSKGGMLVMSAGNSGALQNFPVYDSFTAVSAISSNLSIAGFSSTGTYVDVTGPGASILTTQRGGGYGNSSGTSFSAPMVAGVYALAFAANPGLSPAQAEQIVFSTARDLGAAGKDVQYGHGLVNASAVVTAARSVTGDAIAPQVSFASPLPGSRLAGLAVVNANATDNVAVAKVELLANGVPLGTATASPWSFAFQTADYADGPITLALRAFDGAGNSATASGTFTVANDSVAPTVQIVAPTAGQTVSGTVSVKASATDNNRVSGMTLAIDGKQVATSGSGSLTYSWRVPKPSRKTSGTLTSTLTVTATDPAGNRASTSVSVKR